MVQLNEVNKIKHRWEAAGKPYCSHDRVDKEYAFSDNTGDNACLDCGVTWSRKHHEKPEPTGNA